LSMLMVALESSLAPLARAHPLIVETDFPSREKCCQRRCHCWQWSRLLLSVPKCHRGSMAMFPIASDRMDISKMPLYVSAANTAVIFASIMSGSSSPLTTCSK
jgi:hypothetical protein